MKDILKKLKSNISFHRSILLLTIILLLISLVFKTLITFSIISFFTAIFILSINYLINTFKNLPTSSLNCSRRPEALKILLNLAEKMRVKLHPTRSLEIKPELRGAKSSPMLFIPNEKVYFGSKIIIGCTILCEIDEIALTGILAHEIAHLKRKHSFWMCPVLLILPISLVFIYLFFGLELLILFFLSVVIWIIIFSFTSWHMEYEADRIAAEYTSKEHVKNALEQASLILHRSGDTITHPSFKKRILRL